LRRHPVEVFASWTSLLCAPTRPSGLVSLACSKQHGEHEAGEAEAEVVQLSRGTGLRTVQKYRQIMWHQFFVLKLGFSFDFDFDLIIRESSEFPFYDFVTTSITFRL